MDTKSHQLYHFCYDFPLKVNEDDRELVLLSTVDWLLAARRGNASTRTPKAMLMSQTVLKLRCVKLRTRLWLAAADLWLLVPKCVEWLACNGIVLHTDG